MDRKYLLETAIDTEQIIQFLEDRIYGHNSSKLNQFDGQVFSRIIRDENKNIVAGIGGWTWAGICEITQLWVDERVRKNGIGKMLLEAAEAEAKTKGCHDILVRSYSFQAPDFYRQHGYRIEHIITDFPKGYRYYFLKKEIG